MRSKSGGWIAGTVVIVLAVLAATWFLGAAPKFEEADATTLETESVTSQNNILRTKNAILAADFAKIEDYRQELADLRLQVPTTGELTPLTRNLHDLELANGVLITEILAPPPQKVVVPLAPYVAPPVVETPAEGADDATPVEPPVATAPVAPVLDGFVAVPITVTILGTWSGSVGFIKGVQDSERLFLVTGIDQARQKAATETVSQPLVLDGWVVTKVTGYAYVLIDPTAPFRLGIEPDTGPIPSQGQNPFELLPGSKPTELAAATT